jgi:hypothetical protein
MCRCQKESALRAKEIARNAGLNLRYFGQQPVNIRGAATGNLYQFSNIQPVRPVDSKDAVFLLGNRMFRLSQ